MKDPALELAYAASDAYRYEAENLAVIDGLLDTLGERAEISPLEFLKLREELHVVLTSNRTAPGVMKIMAMADAARVDAGHPKRALAGRLEPVRVAGRHHHHAAGGAGHLAVADGKQSLALLHDEHLGVGVAVQVVAAAGRVRDQEEGDAGAVGVALHQVRGGTCAQLPHRSPG